MPRRALPPSLVEDIDATLKLGDFGQFYTRMDPGYCINPDGTLNVGQINEIAEYFARLLDISLDVRLNSPDFANLIEPKIGKIQKDIADLRKQRQAVIPVLDIDPMPYFNSLFTVEKINFFINGPHTIEEANRLATKLNDENINFFVRLMIAFLRLQESLEARDKNFDHIIFHLNNLNEILIPYFTSESYNAEHYTHFKNYLEKYLNKESCLELLNTLNGFENYETAFRTGLYENAVETFKNRCKPKSRKRKRDADADADLVEKNATELTDLEQKCATLTAELEQFRTRFQNTENELKALQMHQALLEERHRQEITEQLKAKEERIIALQNELNTLQINQTHLEERHRQEITEQLRAQQEEHRIALQAVSDQRSIASQESLNQMLREHLASQKELQEMHDSALQAMLNIQTNMQVQHLEAQRNFATQQRELQQQLEQMTEQYTQAQRTISHLSTENHGLQKHLKNLQGQTNEAEAPPTWLPSVQPSRPFMMQPPPPMPTPAGLGLAAASRGLFNNIPPTAENGRPSKIQKK